VELPGHNWYNASRGPMAKFFVRDPETSDSPKSLFVHGLMVDANSKLGLVAKDGIILQEWVELSQCDGASETVPEGFWRTLVADRWPHGSPAPLRYSRAFLYYLRLSPTGNTNTNRLMAESEIEPSPAVNFVQRVHSVKWNRKLLVAETRKYEGLVPVAAEVGDFSCILTDAVFLFYYNLRGTQMEMHIFSWSEKVMCMGPWRGKPWLLDIMKSNLSLDVIEIFVDFWILRNLPNTIMSSHVPEVTVILLYTTTKSIQV
jgi:hypothetical protein